MKQMEVNWIFDTGLFDFAILMLVFPILWSLKRAILFFLNESAMCSLVLKWAGAFAAIGTFALMWRIWPTFVFGITSILPEFLALAVFAVFAIALVARAYFSFVTPRRTGLWLRKFHVEPEGGFRLSRVLELMSISKVRVITLADSKVAAYSLSSRQSKLKIVLDIFSYLFVPIAMAIVAILIWLNTFFNGEKFGRGGVGKTSLLRGIVGRYPISGGEIVWDRDPIHKLRSDKRAALGVASVPQGREIFPLLTVRENLETGFARLPRDERRIPDDVFDLFPILREMLGRRGGDLSGGQQQQLAIGRALVTRLSLLVLDEPTEGIQPSIIKDIGRAIEYLRQRGDIAILLVEQYFEFARDLADRFYVMDRGEVVMNGRRDEMVEADVRRSLSV